MIVASPACLCPALISTSKAVAAPTGAALKKEGKPELRSLHHKSAEILDSRRANFRPRSRRRPSPRRKTRRSKKPGEQEFDTRLFRWTRSDDAYTPLLGYAPPEAFETLYSAR